MKKVTDWIKNHQTTAFFLLAYVITWPLPWIYYYLFDGETLQ